MLFAIMSGASAIIGITQMRATQASKEITTVYMAKKVVPRGYQIREEDVEPLRIPSNLAHEAMAKSLNDVVGRVAKISIVEGEFVLITKLAEAGVKAGFATTIPSGLRAKSITAITAADRVSGLLNVGDHVDVLLTHATRNGSSNETSVTETLVQNVEVLAIDRTIERVSGQPKSGSTDKTDKGDTKPSSVTLLVTPHEASILSLGQKEGTLSLSLRSPEDQSITSGGSRVGILTNTEYVTPRLQSGAIIESDQYTDGQYSEMDAPDVMQEVALLVNSIPFDDQPSATYSAIRTIRGSSVGVVPIQVKQRSR